MPNQTLQAWAVKAWGLDFADHTYVYCTDNGQYFDCWGGHDGQDKRHVCEGSGVYNIADCYRAPIAGYPDTAGIGVYGVNGVCHQSANCFLFSSLVTLDISVVRGYAVTLLTYGIYGTLFIPTWLPFIYTPCSLRAAGEEGSLSYKLHMMYRGLDKPSTPATSNDVIMKETGVVLEHFVPGIDAGRFADIHGDYLKDKDQATATGIRGEEFANTINVLSAQFQKSLAERLGADDYEKMTGLNAGETLNIVVPELAAKYTI